MPEAIVLTDATLSQLLHSSKPALILISNGEGLRSDFATAFKQAAQQNTQVTFATIDPTQNPQAAERFETSSKPTLIGWWCGTEIVRRVRPWGTDVPLAIEMLQAKERNGVTAVSDLNNTNGAAVNEVITKPINVTRDTFESEVLDSELPVLVDFWAAWCGPCRQVAPALDKLAEEFAGQVRIAKVNVDEQPELAQAFQAYSIPLMVAVKQRVIVYNQPGALPEPVLRDLVQQLIALEIPQEALDQVEAQRAAAEADANGADTDDDIE